MRQQRFTDWDVELIFILRLQDTFSLRSGKAVILKGGSYSFRKGVLKTLLACP